MRWTLPTVISLLLAGSTMAEQIILGSSNGEKAPQRRNMDDFKLEDGKDVMSPKYMLELPRPGAATPNKDGDLAFMVVSNYSFEKKKCVRLLITYNY
ncbi:hypothetical protein FRC14_008031 [Serendipita sp. 396]|nr:hypothetical protein FRC14_008031 [Serendipita sp. 396]KAG8859906.1 hypothetical protein FRC20_011750 [Serendipita sp. 405]